MAMLETGVSWSWRGATGTAVVYVNNNGVVYTLKVSGFVLSEIPARMPLAYQYQVQPHTAKGEHREGCYPAS